MPIERLRSTIRSRPFRTLRLHLAEPGTLRVLHPDFISSTPGGRTLVDYTGDESFQIIDRLLVSRIEVLNGKARSRRGR
jgi:hypothetical protein